MSRLAQAVTGFVDRKRLERKRARHKERYKRRRLREKLRLERLKGSSTEGWIRENLSGEESSVSSDLTDEDTAPRPGIFTRMRRGYENFLRKDKQHRSRGGSMLRSWFEAAGWRNAKLRRDTHPVESTSLHIGGSNSLTPPPRTLARIKVLEKHAWQTRPFEPRLAADDLARSDDINPTHKRSPLPDRLDRLTLLRTPPKARIAQLRENLLGFPKCESFDSAPTHGGIQLSVDALEVPHTSLETPEQIFPPGYIDYQNVPNSDYQELSPFRSEGSEVNLHSWVRSPTRTNTDAKKLIEERLERIKQKSMIDKELFAGTTVEPVVPPRQRSIRQGVTSLTQVSTDIDHHSRQDSYSDGINT